MRNHDEETSADESVQICEPTTFDELGAPFPEMDWALSSAEAEVILDLSALPTIDTVTMTRILELAQAAHEHGKSLRIKNCTDEVYALLRFYKIDKFVHLEA
jgi:ABC-type transporter Mla MlaB component